MTFDGNAADLSQSPIRRNASMNSDDGVQHGGTPPRHGSISETSFGLSPPALVRRTSSENSHGYKMPLLQRQSSSSSDNGMLADSVLRRAASMNSCNSTRELNRGLEKWFAKYKNTDSFPVYDHLQLKEYDQEQESLMRQQAEHEEELQKLDQEQSRMRQQAVRLIQKLVRRLIQKIELQKLEKNMEESFKQLTWQTVCFKSSDNSPDRSAKVGRIQDPSAVFEPMFIHSLTCACFNLLVLESHVSRLLDITESPRGFPSKGHEPRPGSQN
jgi:hypothetical protein